MRLDKQKREIIGKRKVYYVSIYNKRNEVAAFLSSPLSFTIKRPDAALFDNEEEAIALMEESKKTGICCMIPDYSKIVVQYDVQYAKVVWMF